MVATTQDSFESFGIQAEDLEAFGDEDLDIVSSPVHERRVPPPPPIARPPIRPPPRVSDASTQETRIVPGATVMRKHDTGQSSTSSGVMTQHQLATPASTTASSVAPSSLAAAYTQMLSRERDDARTSHIRSEKHQFRQSKTYPTPQTPRQTPRPTTEVSSLRNVESVDLTDDVAVDSVEPRSSSTEVILQKGPVVWTPAAAARPEPLPKTSKKRKSDDVSAASVRKRTAHSPLKKTCYEDDYDEFMDIDDMVHSQTAYKRSDNSIRRSIESPGNGSAMEVELTEMVSRTETRTRKSISRVSSVNEDFRDPMRPNTGESSFLAQGRSNYAKSPRKMHLNVQVAGSPILSRTQSRIGSSPTPTPKMKAERKSQRNIVQDSEEDDEDDNEDLVRDAVRASCLPHRKVKASPKACSIVSPRLQQIPPIKPGFEVYRDKSPRTASPLRLISTNTLDRSHSPLQKQSPSKAIPVTTSSRRIDTALSSSLSSDDKIIASRYLSNPQSIASYSERVKNLKAQSAMDFMTYTDNSEKVPTQLREERIRILDMEKAYNKLEKLGIAYQQLKDEKKNLARQIAHDLEADIDTTVAEDRQLEVTKMMKEHEKEIGNLLHSSGAIADGFGTGSEWDVRSSTSRASLHVNGGTQVATASSTVGSAQVILETQFPSIRPSITQSPVVESVNRTITSPSRSMLGNAFATRHIGSPSPVRSRTTYESYGQRVLETSAGSHSQLHDRNDFRRQTPDDYGVDDDAFYEQMIEEDEQRNENSTSRMIPEEVDDDYGDDDDEEFLAAAQQLESLPSTTNAGASSSKTLRTPSNQSVAKSKGTSSSNMYAHVEHADGLHYPWSNEVKKVLRERFRLRGFRANQLDAINATLGGKDAFVLMPTGGGKSLCYQLPAIVNSGKTRGVTIVISPLLSLMTDQVQHLQDKHIQATLVNGEISKESKDIVFKGLKDPHADQYIQVLYVTPEMVGKSQQLLSAMRTLHGRKQLARIVIDEAHCVSQWGHDFRPDYKTLSGLREKFPGVPFMALTATATQSVKADCIHNLGMDGCKEFKQSFNRPNLFYEIRSKKGKGSGAATLEAMVTLIKDTHKNQTGIVYTLSKKNCEDLAQSFRDNGIKAEHFHAGMRPDDKGQVQRDWQSNKVQVVVATIAFGMGIDKADVRFVIHHTIPKSLEGYYQETGRAGRDGKPSRCYLFYGYQDTAVLRRFIDDSDGGKEVKDSQRAMLKSMVRYCENRDDCRRSNILAYFGESFPREECNNMCDNCDSDAVYETRDLTDIAKSALQVVERFGDDNLTLLYVVDLLRGGSKIKHQHSDSRSCGVAKELPRGEVERVLTRLLMDDILEENNIVNRGGFVTAYLKTGPAADDFKRSKRRLVLPVKISKSPHVTAKATTKQPRKKKALPPTSTIVSSPLGPKSRKGAGKARAQRSHQSDEDEDDDAFIDDAEEEYEEEDAFEPRHKASSRLRRDNSELGPPITLDKRMQNLPEIHQDIVDEFVREAKKLEDRLRNQQNSKRHFFRESDFREMAISWTLSLDTMAEIDGVDQDKVRRYGPKFLPLVLKYYKGYEDVMGQNHRDMDTNHDNVIDLCDDDDDEVEEEEGDQYEEQQSRFFIPNRRVQEFNEQLAQAEQASKSRKQHSPSPEPARKTYSRGGALIRGRGGRMYRKKAPRKSTDSNGTASTSRSRVSKSAGTSKASTSRKNSFASSKSNANTSFSKQGKIFEQFKRKDNGGSGSSFAAMPH